MLAGASGHAWADAAREQAERLGIPLRAHVVGDRNGMGDPSKAFCSAYGLDVSGGEIVRPDGHVAWRRRLMDVEASPYLERVFSVVLRH